MKKLLFLLALVASGDTSQFVVTGYQLEAVQTIDRTHAKFTYGVLLTNFGGDVDRPIQAHVRSFDPEIEVEFPAATSWNPIHAHSTELSALPITLVVTHTEHVNFHALVWSFAR